MKNRTTEDVLFYIGIVIFFLGGISFLFIQNIIPLPSFLPIPCIFHSCTGLYCPGCGITRSFVFLFHGNFLTSFYYYPATLYGTCLYVMFMTSHIYFRFIKKEPSKAMKFHSIYLWIALILVLLNWIIKNALLLF